MFEIKNFPNRFYWVYFKYLNQTKKTQENKVYLHYERPDYSLVADSCQGGGPVSLRGAPSGIAVCGIPSHLPSLTHFPIPLLTEKDVSSYCMLKVCCMKRLYNILCEFNSPLLYILCEFNSPFLPAITIDWSLATILQPNSSNRGSGCTRVNSPSFRGSLNLSPGLSDGNAAYDWNSSDTSAISTCKIDAQ